MKNKKPIYKKLWFWLISIPTVLFLVIGVPLIINKCYIKNEGYPTVWGGSDVLAYYGAALSFVGTTVLGFFTVLIAKKANDVSDRMLKIEEERLIPYLDIERERCKIEESDNDDLRIELYVRNLTPYPIHNILLSLNRPSKNDVKRLYVNDEISVKIIENIKNYDGETTELLCVASLRETIITHYHPNSKGECTTTFEKTPFAEKLVFNIKRAAINEPIELFMTMQNTNGNIFVQRTKIFIVKRRDGEYILTMHSKEIKEIKNL